MSSKLKKRRKNDKANAALDRAFAPDILRKAKELADRYRLILEPHESLGFFGRSIEMPYVCGDGQTADECVRNTREAIVSAAATMIEMGETPPAPASENRRDEQINVRVTVEEKLLLEEAARNKGFRGISDFVRDTTLSSLRLE